MVPARIVVAERDEATHALPAHILQVHPRTRFVALHSNTRRIAPKIEISSAMMTTLPNVKMNLRAYKNSGEPTNCNSEQAKESNPHHLLPSARVAHLV